MFLIWLADRPHRLACPDTLHRELLRVSVEAVGLDQTISLERN